MKLLNWLLYFTHRWIGLVLGLFMFFWFFSGLAIMYSNPINTSRTQQLTHAEKLLPELGWLSLGEVWDRSAEQRQAAIAKRKAPKAEGADNTAKGDGKKAEDKTLTIVDARLVRSANEPLWLVEDSRGHRFSLAARDGSLHETTVDQALKIADKWYATDHKNTSAQSSFVEKIVSTVMLRNNDALSPFHKIAVGSQGDELLISSVTGEVLHASSKVDRAFFWAGNWLHLFKPLESLGLGEIRRDVQLWLGFFATFATLTGLIVGWIRWRPGFSGKPTYSQGRTQPYREFWFKWHFWTGLVGGSFALFWAFSGFMDTNPGKIFSQTTPTRAELLRYQGGDLPPHFLDWRPVLPIELSMLPEEAVVVELSWKHLGNENVLLANTRDGKRLPQTLDGVESTFSNASLLAAAERLVANAPVKSQTFLTEYDSYYYPRHHQGLVEKPLPVVLVELNDKAETRIYLDPQDGKLINKVDSSARVFRWIYSALHHWDFGWLYHRPIWDVWMLFWISFGLFLGGSSVIMGWRLLKKKLFPKKRVATPENSSYDQPSPVKAEPDVGTELDPDVVVPG